MENYKKQSEQKPAYKTMFIEISKLESKEQALQQEYLNYLQTKPVEFWTLNVVRLRKEGQSLANRSEALIFKRLLSYLSLAAYLNSTNALKSGDFVNADRFITLYSIIDPDNPEHKKLREELQIKTGK